MNKNVAETSSLRPTSQNKKYESKLSIFYFVRIPRATSWLCYILPFWRKRGDSNLREPCGPTRFRVVRLQPLGHASVYNFTIKTCKMPHNSSKYVIIVASPNGDAHLISRWMLLTTTSTYAPVAQLDRASACGAEGHTFESCRVYHVLL